MFQHPLTGRGRRSLTPSSPLRVLTTIALLAWPALTPALRAATTPVQADQLVSIDFTARLNPSTYLPKLGPAAVGASPTDAWNIYSPEVDGPLTWRDPGEVLDLVNAAGNPTSVDLAVTNAAGFGASNDPDPMYRTYLYPEAGNLYVTLTDIPEGTYDLYCYAHGAADDRNSVLFLTIGSGSTQVGRTSVGPGWHDGVFVEGEDYVVFRTPPMQTGDRLELTVAPGPEGHAALNGLQWVRLGEAREPPATRVLPPAFASVGDDGSSETLAGSLRLQEVYHQSMLPRVPIQITSLRLRRDPSAPPFKQAEADLRVTLATSTKAPGALSRQWVENLGPEPVTVFDGSLSFASVLSKPSRVQPIPFEIEIPFSQPFLYDPGQGHLLVEFVTRQGAPGAVVDGSNDLDDQASRVFALDSTAREAVYADSGADILEIVYTLPETTCLRVPSNVLAWWPGEETPDDLITGLPATLQSGASYAPGLVGQAFNLTASGSHVRVVNRDDFHSTGAITVEAWIHPSNHGTIRNLVSQWDAVAGSDQRSFSLSLDTEGVPYFIVSATGGDSIVGTVFATNIVVPTNTWTHLAATYDGFTLRVYVDGELRGASVYSGGIHPGTGDLGIGGVVGGLPDGEAISTFSGFIDEVTLYDRGLTANEIMMISQVAHRGKCLPEAPRVFFDPQDTTAVEGGTASFTVEAVGTGPPHYQWWTVEGLPVADATKDTLNLTDIGPEADGAQFYVVISNFVGSATSAPASLTVHTLPRIVSEPQSATALPGSTVTLSVSVTGTPPFIYQWFKDRIRVNGATAPTLVLGNLQDSDTGQYYVWISSPYGSIPSQTAAVIVASGTLSATHTVAGPVFTVQGEAGASYLVEGSTDLRIWHPLAALFKLPETWQIPYLPHAGTPAQRFYRLKKL